MDHKYILNEPEVALEEPVELTEAELSLLVTSNVKELLEFLTRNCGVGSLQFFYREKGGQERFWTWDGNGPLMIVPAIPNLDPEI